MSGWRAGALIALLMLTVVALRGYLPGVAAPAPRDSPAGGGSLVVVLLLAESAVLVVLLGVLGRRRRARPVGEREVRRGRRLTWREVAVAAAVVLVCVLVLAASLLVSRPAEEPNRAAGSTGTAQRPSTEPAPRPGQNPAQASSDTPFLIAAAGLLVGIAVLGAVVLARWQDPPAAEPERPDDDPRPPPEVSGRLARAAELGLAEVSEPGRDPRAAIIACYTAMERGLAEAPDAAPLASDTPSQVLARAIDHGALGSPGAARLVELFTEARFSPHRMTERHRDSAVEWLGAVLDDLRSRR